jgi:hypothetical protein
METNLWQNYPQASNLICLPKRFTSGNPINDKKSLGSSHYHDIILDHISHYCCNYPNGFHGLGSVFPTEHAMED